MKQTILYTLTMLVASCATFSVSTETEYGTVGATYDGKTIHTDVKILNPWGYSK